jgi:hypothetical protein
MKMLERKGVGCIVLTRLTRKAAAAHLRRCVCLDLARRRGHIFLLEGGQHRRRNK